MMSQPGPRASTEQLDSFSIQYLERLTQGQLTQQDPLPLSMYAQYLEPLTGTQGRGHPGHATTQAQASYYSPMSVTDPVGYHYSVTGDNRFINAEDNQAWSQIFASQGRLWPHDLHWSQEPYEVPSTRTPAPSQPPGPPSTATSNAESESPGRAIGDDVRELIRECFCGPDENATLSTRFSQETIREYLALSVVEKQPFETAGPTIDWKKVGPMNSASFLAFAENFASIERYHERLEHFWNWTWATNRNFTSPNACDFKIFVVDYFREYHSLFAPTSQRGWLSMFKKWYQHMGWGDLSCQVPILEELLKAWDKKHELTVADTFTKAQMRTYDTLKFVCAHQNFISNIHSLILCF